MSDKTPSRFSMIAEEMLNEPELVVIKEEASSPKMTSNAMQFKQKRESKQELQRRGDAIMTRSILDFDFRAIETSMTRMAKLSGIRTSVATELAKRDVKDSRSEYWRSFRERYSDKTMRFIRVLDEIRGRLKLDDFANFAYCAHQNNMDRGIPLKDCDRRTGRTTKGLIKALAQCLVEDASTLVVCSMTRPYNVDLRDKVASMTVELALPTPTRVELVIFADLGAWESRNSTRFSTRNDVVVYTDHSIWY